MPTFGTAAGHDPIWSVSGSSPVFPATGSTASVRDDLTLSTLGTVTFSAGGVWSFTSGAGIDYIDLQAPSGTWVGPFMSKERQQASATFLTVANAVPLSTATPATLTAAGFAGTAATASRGDHSHPWMLSRPVALNLTATTMPMHPIGGGITPFSLNRLLYGPTYIVHPNRAPLTCTTIGVNVTTAGSAGATIRFGLYGSNADGGINQSNLIFQSGEIAATTTGLKTFAYTTPIPEGIYYAACVPHVAVSSWTGSLHGMILPGPTVTSTTDCRYQDGVTGTLPSSGAVTGGDGIPAFFYTVP